MPKKKKGFTLIEMLLVVAVVIVLGIMGDIFYSSFYLNNTALAASRQLTAELRKAQTYSVEGKQGSGWGVAFTGGNIVLYEGSSYATRNAAFDEDYTVPSSVAIAGFTEVDFARVTGYPSITTTAVIAGEGDTYEVTIQPQGIIVMTTLSGGATNYPYAYERAIAVTSTTSVASGTESNFPMLVSSTLSSWEPASFGGHIQNLCTAPNGGQEPCDLVYSLSSLCSNPLNFETESYISSTGALVDWVNVPVMQASQVIYACYGSSTVATDQSHPSATWNSNYAAVWHLPTPTSTLNLNDSSADLINGTNSGATSTSLGQIDGAASFNGGQQVAYSTGTAIDTINNFTISSWFYTSSSAAGTRDILDHGANGWALDTSGVTPRLSKANVGAVVSCSSTVSASQWYYSVGTVTTNSEILYLNGTQCGSSTSTTSFSTSSAPMIGSFGGSAYWIGAIDESRVSNVVLSPSWILTEYNNQSSPSTFYNMGSEIVLNSGTSAPVLTSISPTSTAAGGSSFTLTASGWNFVSGATINWNGAPLTTTFVSSSSLTTTIASSSIAVGATIPVTVVNPSGGGTSGSATFTVLNPAPTLSSISPTSTTTGGGNFTLTATGSNFVSGATINWNGAPLTTTFVSSSSLTATIASSSITTGGTSPITVTNPTPGGGTSGSVTFTIINAVPTLTSISPTSTAPGSSAFTLTATGTNFVNSESTINWNGVGITTTFISSTSLQATIPSGDVTSNGTSSVTIVNSTPGGGTSGASIFTVTSTPGGYVYERSITVTSTTSVASGTETNFPMLVSSTLASWESTSTAGGAGHIQNLCTAPNGGQEPCDLVYSTSTICANPLNFETESYTSSTGALVDWVNVPSFSAGTVLYACYGNSLVSSDQSHPSATWNSNYGAVWHFTSASSSYPNDSTANSHVLTNSSMTKSTGIIGGGMNESGSSYMIISAPIASLQYAASQTISAWIQTTSTNSNGAGFVFNQAQSGASAGFALTGSVSGTTWVSSAQANNAFNLALGKTVINDGNWHYITETYSSGLISNYTDGVLQATTTNGTVIAYGSSQPVYIGRNFAGSAFLTGNIDEARIIGVAEGPSWILTEYNNQNSPSTFYAIGSETTPH